MPTRLTLLNVVFAFVAVVVAGLLWHWATTPMVVSVSGTGRVSVPAEKAAFSVTVSVVDPDLTHAVTEVRQKVTTLRGLLENEGISSDWVSETQLQVMPVGALVAGATGNQAVVTLLVETPYVNTVSQLVVFLYQNGATLVSQPVVVAENQQDLENQALQEALAKADQSAKMISRKKWKFFRRPISITQASSGQAATETKAGLAMTETGELVPGGDTFEIVQAVSVVYELR